MAFSVMCRWRETCERGEGEGEGEGRGDGDGERNGEGAISQTLSLFH